MEALSVNQREVWLCPFPFSDLSGEKVRPVLILSNHHYNATSEDVIVCALTSHTIPKPYALIVDKSDCESGTLFDPSSSRVDTLFKLKKTLLKKAICTLKPKTFNTVMQFLINIFE